MPKHWKLNSPTPAYFKLNDTEKPNNVHTDVDSDQMCAHDKAILCGCYVTKCIVQCRSNDGCCVLFHMRKIRKFPLLTQTHDHSTDSEGERGEKKSFIFVAMSQFMNGKQTYYHQCIMRHIENLFDWHTQAQTFPNADNRHHIAFKNYNSLSIFLFVCFAQWIQSSQSTEASDSWRHVI